MFYSQTASKQWLISHFHAGYRHCTAACLCFLCILSSQLPLASLLACPLCLCAGLMPPHKQGEMVWECNFCNVSDILVFFFFWHWDQLQSVAKHKARDLKQSKRLLTGLLTFCSTSSAWRSYIKLRQEGSLDSEEGDEESSVSALFASLQPKAMGMIHNVTWTRQRRFIISHYRVTVRHAVVLFAWCLQSVCAVLSAVTLITECLFFSQRNGKHISSV